MIIRADARALPLRDACVQTCVTSPPYFGLRDYGNASQIGLEPTPDAYVAALVEVFREVRRVLKDDGTCWLNLGDSYATGKPRLPEDLGRDLNWANRQSVLRSPEAKSKDLLGIPWRVAFALQADGWYLRSDIIWSKPNPMPESVTDRPTKAHEYLFLLSKQERYYYDAAAIAEPATRTLRPSEEKNGFYHSGEYGERATQHGRKLHWGYRGEATKDYKAAGAQNPSDTKRRILDAMAEADYPGRNKRSVWTVPTMPYSGAHFATFPEKLIEPCILAGCPMGGLVLDPFLGSGTVGVVAERLGRRWVGIDLSYQPLSKARTRQRGIRFEETA